MTVQEGEPDSVGRVVTACLRDISEATTGLNEPLPAVAPLPDPAGEMQRLLDAHCVAHVLPDGRRAYIARKGRRPVLLIGALGVPAFFWAQTLQEAAPDWRPVFIETRCGDLVEGGMASAQSFVDHADDLAESLRFLRIGPTSVIAWCNGGRVAVSLARRAPEIVDALVLIATTFRGARNIEPKPSPFEDNLGRLFDDLRRKPTSAKFATKLLRVIVEGKADLEDPDLRARRFLGSARTSDAAALIAPMSTPEFLLNFAQRTALDEGHDISAELAALQPPALCLIGDSDDVINTSHCADAVRLAPSARVVLVAGAGHYIHDLQHRYFRDVVTRFLANPSAEIVGGRHRLTEITQVSSIERQG